MTTRGARADLLAAILASTRRIVDVRRAREPLGRLAARAEACRPRGNLFERMLARDGSLNVIAECKRRSPGRGLLRPEYDPARLAATYATNGAAAISVLTEPTFFDGEVEHLAAVRGACELPVLRKDFVVDEYQLYETRAAGADATLLIVAALDPARLKALLRLTDALGLAALVEAHAGEEVALAVGAGARVIGVNNRDLRTLDVSQRTALDLVGAIPNDVIAVAESGIGRREDVRRLHEAGYDAFLVGERLVSAADPGLALRQLTGVSPGLPAVSGGE